MRVRYSNAHVWLPNGEITDSLVVEDGLFALDDGSIDTEIDCGGNTIWPAFVDSHAHPLLGGRELLGPQIAQLNSVESICAEIARWLTNQVDFAGWLVCGAYDRSMVAEGRFRAEWLDAVSTEVPIVVHANDHHSIWVNSKALELAGLTRVPEDLENFIDHEAFMPTGVLREDKAKALILDRVTERPSAAAEALVVAHQKLASLGIVSVLDAWVDAAGAQTYLAVTKSEQANKLLRTRLAYWMRPTTWNEDIFNALTVRDELAKTSTEIRLTQAKFFIDGVFGSETALVKQPYRNGSFGYSPWHLQQLVEAITASVSVGLRPHLHAIGDQAVEIALTALASVAKTKGRFAATLVHAELLSGDQIRAIADLGLSVNLQPLWGRCDSMWQSTAEVLGERANYLYRTRDLLDAGVQLGFGSDWPVSDANPLAGIFTAVTRRVDLDAPSQNKDQAISMQEAISTYTLGSSEQIELRNCGSITVGMRADFIVIDGNLDSMTLADLQGLKVLETVSGGQRIFTRH